jgi:hypothetical protein
MAITKEILDELLKDYQKPKTCLDKCTSSDILPNFFTCSVVDHTIRL